jgi:hypothetical protein
MQKNEERRRLLGDLWSTLFLVVPVLSTTFASVERMLGDVPPDTLGWLLVDEAGQATPQAALGAILRAKRTIAVGDPLQIQPVVSLPERLNADICDCFKVDELEWTAPAASTQTLTDRASRYQSSFEAIAGERRVGLPLLVHRRCQNPMFAISNKIAYAGQMVQVVGPKDLNGWCWHSCRINGQGTQPSMRDNSDVDRENDRVVPLTWDAAGLARIEHLGGVFSECTTGLPSIDRTAWCL